MEITFETRIRYAGRAEKRTEGIKEDFCKIWQVGFPKYEPGKSEQQDNTTKDKPITYNSEKNIITHVWEKSPLDPITLKDSSKHLSKINKSSQELLTYTLFCLVKLK